MKAARLIPSILLAASVLLTPEANGAGMLMVDPIPGMPMPVIHPLPIVHPGHPTPKPGETPLLKGSVMFGLRMQKADVKVDINDSVAKTYVTQTFINESDHDVAGTYLFPLPDDTTFSSFSLMIDGKPVEGKILEAQEARQTYEAIVRRLVDPGLLEYADYKTIRARIFPIPAHGTKKVELEYTQLLKAEGGLMKYRFPLKTEGAGATDEVDVRVKLSSKQGLRTIWSPSHTITTNRDGDHAAKIAYAAHDAVPDKDFFLYYSLSDKDLAASVLTHKDSGEDGYYLLTLAPPVESKEVAAKDIVMVADTSGSMAGERMDQNKKALKYLVNALTADDRFSIIQFNTDVDSFKPQLLPATAENKKLATAYIDDLEARGGTNIGDAIKTAGTMLDTASGAASRPAYVILMTDGEPTVGETSEAGLLKSVSAKRDVRLFDFGVGYDVNTKLLNKLAEEHHGTAHYVEPDESIETSLSNFYNKIKSPVLTDVKIAYDGIEVKDSYPREVKDIFAGGQVLVLGRYKKSGDATIKLTGAVNGAQKTYSFPVAFAAAEADHTYLPRLWAMRRIGHLTDIAKDNGDNREVVDEIVSLSKKYGIISQYTSFLVTDPNEMNAHGMPVGVVGTPGSGGGFVRRSDDSRLRGGLREAAPTSAPTMGRLTRRTDAAPPPPLPASRLDSFAASGFGGATFGDERTSAQAADAVVAFAKAAPVGKDAVIAAKKVANLKQEEVAMQADGESEVKSAGDKTFMMRDGIWIDSAYNDKSSPKAEEITFGSKEYFELMTSQPGISKYLAVGRQVLFVFNGHTYKITFKETA